MKTTFSPLMIDRIDTTPIKVLPKGSRFSIHLSRITTGFVRSSHNPNVLLEPEAEVTIDDDLYLKNGKKITLNVSRFPLR